MMQRLRSNILTTLSVSRFELSKKKLSFRPAAVIGLLIVFGLFALAFVLLSQYGYRPNHNYFRVTPTGTALDAYIEASDIMRVTDRGAIRAYTRSDGTYIIGADTRFQSMAATAAILQTIKDQNRQLLLSSGLQPPFLVLLNITTRQREEILDQPTVQVQRQTESGAAGVRVTQDDTASVAPDPQPAVTTSLPIPEDGTQLPTQQITRPMGRDASEDSATVGVQSTNITSGSRSGSTVQTPQGLTYPDDINTLVGVKQLFILIQLMLVCNFFSALQGNSFFEEKLNYRSSLLFSAPLERHTVIIGKLLPYLLLALGIACILVGVQQPHLLLQPLFYVLIFVLAIVYFSFSFLNGLLARSNKEYSFLNVFTTAILSLYLLIPAFIANYSTLGYASLLTPVLLLAQQQAVQLSLVLFLVLVYSAMALVVFVMGSAIWNFEHLYKYESPMRKVLYIIRSNTRVWWQYIVYGALCVPFLWLVQIVLIALFLVVPIDNKLFLLLLGAALSEEFVRTMASRAHIRYVRESPLPRALGISIWKQSLLIALGFGITEKLILLAAIAPYLEGYQFIVTTGVLVPIGLHFLFTFLFSWLMLRTDFGFKHPNILCLTLGLLHAIFNYTVITLFGVHLI